MEEHVYNQCVKDITKALKYRFTNSNSEIDAESIARFIVDHYYLKNGIKAKTDVLRTLDMTEEELKDL